MTTATTDTAASTTTRWSVDASHTTVGFTVRHMMISNVRGEFQKLEGEVELDLARPQAAKITASIDVASINTREEKRDAHLRSADFFDAENHPRISYTSRSVRKRGDGLEVEGDLTIRGATRPVTLTVEEVTPEHVDPWGNRRIGASAKAKIKRSDFGMTWNAALEAGGVLVADDVTIHIDVELVKQA